MLFIAVNDQFNGAIAISGERSVTEFDIFIFSKTMNNSLFQGSITNAVNKYHTCVPECNSATQQSLEKSHLDGQYFVGRKVDPASYRGQCAEADRLLLR